MDIAYGKLSSYLRWDIVKLIAHLHKEEFSMIINLYGIFSLAGRWKMRLLCALIGAKVLVGRNTNGWGSFYDIKIDERDVDKRHTVELMTEVISLLGADKPTDIYPRLPILKEDENFAEEYLHKHNIDEKNILIGFNTDSQLPSHR